MSPSFWHLIHDASAGGEASPEALQRVLSKLGPEAIVEFDRNFWQCMSAAYRWDLWGVFSLSWKKPGQEGFMAFRAWLIAQGKDAFDAALDNPDSIADRIRPEAGMEHLTYAAREAYRQQVGSELPTATLDLFAEPQGVMLKDRDLPKLFPKVSAALS